MNQAITKPSGRPPMPFNQELADAVCHAIESGISINDLSEIAGISHPTIYRWLDENPSFNAAYTRARTNQADTSADTIDSIAGKVMRGEMDPQAARVAIDALKWTASKRRPRVYGDTLNVNIDATVSITAALQQARGRLIEAELVKPEPAPPLGVAGPSESVIGDTPPEQIFSDSADIFCEVSDDNVPRETHHAEGS